MSIVTRKKVAKVVCDPDGDCILVLPCEHGITRFQVNSHTLCLASAVFRAMLSAKSNFREGQSLASRSTNSPPLEIIIADDDPPALATVLQILHFQYDCVTESPTTDQLFLVAVICDKYEMRQALELWWKGSSKPPIMEHGSYHKWLFIAYTFAKGDLFTKLSKHLILNTSLDPDSDQLLHNGEIYNIYIPATVIGICIFNPRTFHPLMPS